MTEKIIKKIEELNKEKNNYLDILEMNMTRYDEEYIYKRINECRIKINVLLEVLEYEED